MVSAESERDDEDEDDDEDEIEEEDGREDEDEEEDDDDEYDDEPERELLPLPLMLPLPLPLLPPPSDATRSLRSASVCAAAALRFSAIRCSACSSRCFLLRWWVRTHVQSGMGCRSK